MRRGVFIGLFLLCALAALGQRFGGMFRDDSEAPRPSFPVEGEFHFVRVEYTDLPQFHRAFRFASRRAEGDGWWILTGRMPTTTSPSACRG